MSSGRITTLIILTLIFVGVAALIMPDFLAAVVMIVLGIVVAMVAAGALILVLHFLVDSREHLRLSRAKRLQAESEANTTIVTAKPGEQVYVRELKPGGTWRSLHLDPRTTINGREVSDAEIQRWLYYQAMTARRAAAAPAAAQMPLLEEPGAINLLEYLPRVQRGLIVGNSEAGKSTLMQWLVKQRLETSERVFVIDPHAAADSWPPGVQVVGAGNKFNEIQRALQSFVDEMDRRYEEIAAGICGHRQHPIWTVVVDEWMSIKTGVPGASEYLSRLLREARKAGIDPFAGSHSRTVKALGLSGADERDGFAVVLLHWDQFRQIREAVIEVPKLDGKTERIPAILPGEFGGWHVVEPAGELPEPMPFDAEPNDEELQVLGLHRSGASYREISQAVWGKYGAFYNEKIDKIVKAWEDWEPPMNGRQTGEDRRPDRRNFRIIG